MPAEGNHFWLNDLKALKGQNLKFKQIDFIASLVCLIKEIVALWEKHQQEKATQILYLPKSLIEYDSEVL